MKGMENLNKEMPRAGGFTGNAGSLCWATESTPSSRYPGGYVHQRSYNMGGKRHTKIVPTHLGWEVYLNFLLLSNMQDPEWCR